MHWGSTTLHKVPIPCYFVRRLGKKVKYVKSVKMNVRCKELKGLMFSLSRAYRYDVAHRAHCSTLQTQTLHIIMSLEYLCLSPPEVW